MDILVERGLNALENAEHRATTTGNLFLDGQPICYTLERTSTLIPDGTYPVKMIYSSRFQRTTPHILNVTGRTEIEIHGANTADDVDGCIGVAEKRISDYEIYESEPATTTIENSLRTAEANNEVNTVAIRS